jgi:hypothetical protein
MRRPLDCECAESQRRRNGSASTCGLGRASIAARATATAPTTPTTNRRRIAEDGSYQCYPNSNGQRRALQCRPNTPNPAGSPMAPGAGVADPRSAACSGWKLRPSAAVCGDATGTSCDVTELVPDDLGRSSRTWTAHVPRSTNGKIRGEALGLHAADSGVHVPGSRPANVSQEMGARDC